MHMPYKLLSIKSDHIWYKWSQEFLAKHMAMQLNTKNEYRNFHTMPGIPVEAT